MVARALNVALLEAVSFTATYYGITIQGHHVAVLVRFCVPTAVVCLTVSQVKANKDQLRADAPPLSVDVKCSKQFLADALIDELTQIFGA